MDLEKPYLHGSNGEFGAKEVNLILSRAFSPLAKNF